MNKKTKICVFIDGYAFGLVSRYFKFGHQIKRGINFDGLFAYIQKQAAELIGVNEKNCAVIGRHLYKGVLAGRAATPEQAKKDSAYSDLLKKHNITPHFRDLWTIEGCTKEKMVDPDLICDALEMAFKKEFDVLVLIACDTDFVPMVEKLNKWAVDSVLFWWDLPEYEVNGIKRKPQRTSELLIQSVKHHVEMSPIADKRKKTELEENIFSNPRSPTKENQREQQPFQSYKDKPKKPAPDKVEHPPIEQPSIVDKIENLVMNFEPRVLTEEELRKTWVSIVVTVTQDGWGYVKGPVEFKERTLNNFQFGTQDIGDRHINDFQKGQKVQFRLKPDPKRSERFGYPLYRAYDIVLLDSPASSAKLEQFEPKAPKQNPASGFPVPATLENDDKPVSPVQSMQKIDLHKEELDDHLVGADKEVIEVPPINHKRLNMSILTAIPEIWREKSSSDIHGSNVDSAVNSETRERRRCIVVKKNHSANIDSTDCFGTLPRPKAAEGRVGGVRPMSVLIKPPNVDFTDDPEI